MSSVSPALALHCTINAGCRFARKHYFYPDMPKNFQISQYEEPLAVEGSLEVASDGTTRRIGIERLHMEEDVGKLIHEGTLAAILTCHQAIPLTETGPSSGRRRRMPLFPRRVVRALLHWLRALHR